MENHLYIKIDVKCTDSAVCYSKIVKARLNDIVGHIISDFLEESDNNISLKRSPIENENTDIDSLTPVSMLK